MTVSAQMTARRVREVILDCLANDQPASHDEVVDWMRKTDPFLEAHIEMHKAYYDIQYGLIDLAEDGVIWRLTPDGPESEYHYVLAESFYWCPSDHRLFEIPCFEELDG